MLMSAAHRLLLSVGILASCEATDRRQPPVEMPVGSCLADALRIDHTGFTPSDDCASDTPACQDRCDNDEADACMQRAVLLQPLPDKGLAAHGLYLKACRLGLANACTNWAAGEWVHELGQAPQCLRAVFAKACDVGDMFACGMVGRVLLQDPSFPGDRIRAHMLLEMACERDAATCNLLAMYVDDSSLGPADPARASHLYDRACKAGNTDVCANEHGR